MSVDERSNDQYVMQKNHTKEERLMGVVLDFIQTIYPALSQGNGDDLIRLQMKQLNYAVEVVRSMGIPLEDIEPFTEMEMAGGSSN